MKAFCSCFLSGNSRPTLFQESVGIDLRLDLTGQSDDMGAEVFDQRSVGVVGADGVHLRLAALARLDALEVEADVVERGVGEGAGLAVIVLPEGTAGVHRRGGLGREGEGLACAWAGLVDIEDLELALSCRLCLGQLAADKVVHEMAFERVLRADLLFGEGDPVVDALRAADAVLSVEDGKDKAIVLKLRIARPAIVGVKELVAVVKPGGFYTSPNCIKNSAFN